jgi:hypothetical protein
MRHPPYEIKHPPVFRGGSLSLERANERGVSDRIAGLPEMLCRGLCAESVCPTAQDVGGRDGHVPERSWGSGVGMDVSSSLLLGAIKREDGQVFQGLAAFFFRSAIVTPTSEAMEGQTWRLTFALCKDGSLRWGAKGTEADSRSGCLSVPMAVDHAVSLLVGDQIPFLRQLDNFNQDVFVA